MGDVLKPVGVYASYIQAGDFLYISGQIGIADGALVDGGFREQLDQVFHNLRQVFGGAGISAKDVVKTTVFLVCMDNYEAMNQTYCDFFGHHRPARSTVAVASLPLGALVEVEAIAYLVDDSN